MGAYKIVENVVIQTMTSLLERYRKTGNFVKLLFVTTQEIFPEDQTRRMEFCEEMMEKANGNGRFIEQILFTDESSFSLHGHHNPSVAVGYSRENKHLSIPQRTQYPQKGSVDVRAELERLQDAVSSLQKRNLCLEAENLDFKLDLEKCDKEVPRLNEQIQHLESYIDVLKNENAIKELGNAAALPSSSIVNSGEAKKIPELERTVFMLKRVVEKLQAENKRLVSGKRPLSDRSVSMEKLKRDNTRLKEQHAESLQKISQLEKELTAARNKAKSVVNNDNVVALSDELDGVREQLEQKSHLLDKVKVLLHRAATKEKALLQEISQLRSQRDGVISPIQEESEDSSDL
ncbi:hypothetical protein NQ318_017134 [Aromia moschata]|uniref:Uncharacterized protein n=1 Tax=Aromia moschata TaxID=1265417 RepID=A0AAV8X7J9_9CUCU|nr:hypothetical protein NQ318_017134 [Aromia moschata]